MASAASANVKDVDAQIASLKEGNKLEEDQVRCAAAHHGFTPTDVLALFLFFLFPLSSHLEHPPVAIGISDTHLQQT